MIVILAFLSLFGVVVAVVLPGWSDLLLLAGPCLVASLWLWFWHRVGRVYDPLRDIRRVGQGQSPQRHGKARRAGARKAKADRPHVIIDGSNVMHWQGNVPSLVPVVAAVLALEARGFTVGVIFDANVGYKIHDRFLGHHAMARRVNLPEDQVFVVPKGTVADQYILMAARDLGARVVTNDRYRDWLEAFPEAAEPGFLIRGSANDRGEVTLNAGDLAAGAVPSTLEAPRSGA